MKSANQFVGKRIKEMRKKAKLNRKLVAEYLGVEQRHLSKIEAGKCSISVEQLERLAELYGCDASAFDDRDITINPVRFASLRRISAEDIRVVAEISHIASNSRYMATLLNGRNDKRPI